MPKKLTPAQREKAAKIGRESGHLGGRPKGVPGTVSEALRDMRKVWKLPNDAPDKGLTPPQLRFRDMLKTNFRDFYRLMRAEEDAARKAKEEQAVKTKELKDEGHERAKELVDRLISQFQVQEKKHG